MTQPDPGSPEFWAAQSPDAPTAVCGGIVMSYREWNDAADRVVSHPQVIDAAVIGVPDHDFGEKPLAFIISAPQSRPSDEDLRRHLSERLANYKKPREFVFVDEFPRNPMGKVLKHQLREPYWKELQRHV